MVFDKASAKFRFSGSDGGTAWLWGEEQAVRANGQTAAQLRASNGADLADTDAEVTDHAMSSEVCPVGCIIRKRVGFVTPIGERDFDNNHAVFRR